MNPLVSCRNLVWRSGGQLILSQLNLDLQGGESLALLGASGSGKSTLLRIIAGLETPEEGEVFVDGRLVTRGARMFVAPHQRQLAMLFQDLALWPNLSIADNVALGLSGLHLPRRTLRDRVNQALEMCGIQALADRLPGTLSGGQQQRVALARSLSVQPQLLLLDEPFGGLDLMTRQSVIGEVSRLKNEFDFALILVTHDPAEVRALCDSLCVLDAGRAVDRRQLRDIGPAPQSTLGQAFVRLLHTQYSDTSCPSDITPRGVPTL